MPTGGQEDCMSVARYRPAGSAIGVTKTPVTLQLIVRPHAVIPGVYARLLKFVLDVITPAQRVIDIMINQSRFPTARRVSRLPVSSALEVALAIISSPKGIWIGGSVDPTD